MIGVPSRMNSTVSNLNQMLVQDVVTKQCFDRLRRLTEVEGDAILRLIASDLRVFFEVRSIAHEQATCLRIK